MFGRFTTTIAGASRHICREMTAAATWSKSGLSFRQQQQQQQQLASITTFGLGSGGSLPPGNEQAKQQVKLRFYASKASKFGKRIKKETFNRYMGMDPSRLQCELEEVKELENANETVRRLFSLEYATRKQIVNLYKRDTFEAIRHDPTDASYCNYLVTSITRLTVAVRNLAPQVERFPRDKKKKSQMILLMDRRRKHIKYLRKTNFDICNRLLETLGVEFTPAPLYSHQQTRRYVEKSTICERAFNDRQRSLGEFTSHMKKEQLAEIAQIKKSLGMDLNELEKGRLDQ